MSLLTGTRRYPPDPIDKPDVPSYGSLPDIYGGESKPKPPVYGSSYPIDYKPPSPPDYAPKPKYETPDTPIYVPITEPPPYGIPPEPECKADNICDKKGLKCCACADCSSDSFGCAETCACCPPVSIATVQEPT